jgi:hypothetical protein
MQFISSAPVVLTENDMKFSICACSIPIICANFNFPEFFKCFLLFELSCRLKKIVADHIRIPSVNKLCVGDK